MSTPGFRAPRVRAGETLGIALESVRTHRMRSLLTVLGIWIGIASVTLTVGLGQGAQAQVAEQIDSLGSNLLVVSPGSSTTGGVRTGRDDAGKPRRWRPGRRTHHSGLPGHGGQR